MTPGEPFAIADDLFRMGRGVLWVQVESDHPDWEAEQIKREVARQLMLGVEAPGCDLAAWLRLHADEFGDGPWAADKPCIVAANPVPAERGRDAERWASPSLGPP